MALLAATGSRVRKLPLPGAEDKACRYLRGIDDVGRPAAGDARRLAACGYIGAGYIGLEVGSRRRKARAEGYYRAGGHAAGTCTRSLTPDRRVLRGRASQGRRGRALLRPDRIHGANGRYALVIGASSGLVAADVVLIGVGILPNVELARDAGLEIDNGIRVNAFAQTDDPDIYAVGDCANLPNSFAEQGRVRLESVQNAIDQAKHAALVDCRQAQAL
jgi:3-phenylpropionate/trans-cinnamate dioxygenase ferredoxin reductase subunit